MAKRLIISRNGRFLIVAVHLLPLPGSPRWGESFTKVIDAAVDDARACQDGGADALLIENFGDVPFNKGPVSPETLAAMAVIGMTVKAAVRLPIGFNVLRNDGHAALALCASCGGEFIRVNVLCGAMVTDQGVIEGNAFTLTRLRRQLAPKAKVLADVYVKHASPLGNLPIGIAARDTAERGLADAIIVSGVGTGEEAKLDEVRSVRSACPRTPLLIGSGVTEFNCASYLEVADGVIVGTSVKREGKIYNPIDSNRVRTLRRAMH